ncbi:MAG: hypothetical protein CMN85_10475 [Spongiibacteraceae bacterium]|nr:hypothetical protein [Spongiibacteraceae bacterium]|tara:strand:- start:481 stop:1050 length:570 start_codon:yes stop_codon:yes gene_type:complete
MKASRKLLPAIFLATSVGTNAAPTYTEKDIYIDDKTRPYKDLIVAGINKVARENSRCKRMEPSSAYISGSRGTKDNPVFFVTCYEGNNPFNVWFSKSDIEGGKHIAAKGNISRRDAVSACRKRAKQLANHPSTVRFSAIMDAAYTPHPGGNTSLYSTFTAKNSFNLEQKFKIKCLFKGSTMVESVVTEI